MKGYLKIEGGCRTAKAYDYEYVWVDTCCIDKSSSAELSEAVRPSSSVLIIVVD
jgi:hypothetical protein